MDWEIESNLDLRMGSALHTLMEPLGLTSNEMREHLVKMWIRPVEKINAETYSID